MTKEFDLPSGKYVVVKVPDDARGFCEMENGNICYLYGQGLGNFIGKRELPFSSLIAPIKDLTEPQVKAIGFETILEFAKFLHSLEIYSVNPYGESEPENCVFTEKDVAELEEKVIKWQTAQANTGTHILLKKI